MIQEVWGLKLESKVLGIRALTVGNRYYDIDIDIYKQRLKLDTSALKCLRLMEYGDLLVTEDEFDGGYFVEDGSDNEQILMGVKDFVEALNLRDPRIRAKRAKKADEIRKKFYTYLPQKWLREFAEYHLDYFEGNDNIYSSFTQQQFDIIKEYFRWRSRLIFEELKANKILQAKPRKTAVLIDLMGNANDWVYDGTVDMGYKGGGVCELGHPLRYEHYAYSKSTNKQIIFGSTCMSDFFQVDETVIRHINQAQETLLKEIKSIVFVMRTGKFKEYADDYSNLWDILRHFKGQFNDKTKNGSGWSKFIGGFSKLGLPLTRSMTMKYKELVKQYEQDMKRKEMENKLQENISKLDSNYRQTLENIMKDSYQLTLARNIKLQLLFGNNSSPVVQEGLKLVQNLLTIQEKLRYELGFSQKFLSAVKVTHAFVYENSNRRLATNRDLTLGMEVVREPYLGVDKSNQLFLLMKECSKLVPMPIKEVPSQMPIDAKTYETHFIKVLDTLKQAVKWGMSENFNEDIAIFSDKIGVPPVKEQQKFSFTEESKPQQSVTDKESNTDPLQFKYNYIENNAVKLTEAERRAFNNLNTEQLTGSRDEPFIREMYQKVYNAVNGIKLKEEEEPISDFQSTPVAPNASYEVKIKALEDASEDDLIPKSAFVFKIIETIKRSGRVSEKQMKYIDEALDKLSSQF